MCISIGPDATKLFRTQPERAKHRKTIRRRKHPNQAQLDGHLLLPCAGQLPGVQQAREQLQPQGASDLHTSQMPFSCHHGTRCSYSQSPPWSGPFPPQASKPSTFLPLQIAETKEPWQDTQFRIFFHQGSEEGLASVPEATASQPPPPAHFGLSCQPQPPTSDLQCVYLIRGTSLITFQ